MTREHQAIGNHRVTTKGGEMILTSAGSHCKVKNLGESRRSPSLFQGLEEFQRHNAAHTTTVEHQDIGPFGGREQSNGPRAGGLTHRTVVQFEPPWDFPRRDSQDANADITQAVAARQHLFRWSTQTEEAGRTGRQKAPLVTTRCENTTPDVCRRCRLGQAGKQILELSLDRLTVLSWIRIGDALVRDPTVASIQTAE